MGPGIDLLEFGSVNQLYIHRIIGHEEHMHYVARGNSHYVSQTPPPHPPLHTGDGVGGLNLSILGFGPKFQTFSNAL